MVFNVQSLNKRIDQFIAMLDDHNLQIAFVTETWLTSEANPITATLKASGYEIRHNFRANRAGGGTAVIFQQGYQVSKLPVTCDVTTFEFICVLIKQEYTLTIMGTCIYRPGSQPLCPLFIAELDKFLDTISSKYDSILLCGDLNVHF